MDANDPSAGINLDQLLRQLTPEQQQRYLRPYQQESDILKQEVARATRPKQKSAPAYGLWGGVFSGLGDSLGDIADKVAADRARGQQEKLLGDEQSSAGDVLNALRQSGQPPGGGMDQYTDVPPSMDLSQPQAAAQAPGAAMPVNPAQPWGMDLSGAQAPPQDAQAMQTPPMDIGGHLPPGAVSTAMGTPEILRRMTADAPPPESLAQPQLQGDYRGPGPPARDLAPQDDTNTLFLDAQRREYVRRHPGGAEERMSIPDGRRLLEREGFYTAPLHHAMPNRPL